MRKKIEWKFELIEDSPASSVKRAKVIGGWILVHQTFININTHSKAKMSESTVFIPDRDHEWTISTPIPEESRNVD
jgi:hypothetical protein